VAIRTSASQEVRRLVGDLSLEGPDGEPRREAAIARLAVIGTRAVRQLLEALNSATSSAQRAAILGALEAIPDHRTVEAVRALLGAPETFQEHRIELVGRRQIEPGGVLRIQAGQNH